MLKVDSKHKDYEGKILTSAGIGRNYHKSFNAKKINIWVKTQKKHIFAETE